MALEISCFGIVNSDKRSLVSSWLCRVIGASATVEQAWSILPGNCKFSYVLFGLLTFREMQSVRKIGEQWRLPILEQSVNDLDYLIAIA